MIISKYNWIIYKTFKCTIIFIIDEKCSNISKGVNTRHFPNSRKPSRKKVDLFILTFRPQFRSEDAASLPLCGRTAHWGGPDGSLYNDVALASVKAKTHRYGMHKTLKKDQVTRDYDD